MTGPAAGAGADRPVGRVVALVPDLLDRSRITEAAKVSGGGPEVAFVSSVAGVRTRLAEAGAPPPAVVVVDLARPGVLDALPELRGAAPGARFVGFGPHVDGERLAAARAAGCDRVLARSAFFAGLPGVLDP